MSGDQALATEADVVACYRLLLGRAPENDAVVRRHLADQPRLATLRRRFMESPEFRSAVPSAGKALVPLVLPPPPIEISAAPEALAALLARIGRYWIAIGQQAPHWSVLTQDRFLPEQIAAHEAAFWASGAADRDLLLGALSRHGLAAVAGGTCLEFGCGVGRATLALAPHVGRIIGCDISPAHLALAEQRRAALGLTSEWYGATIAAPMPAGGWDLWYSRLVLQHNPPPVIAHLLGLAFAGLRPGGVALFQVPVHRKAYTYSLAADLADPRPPRMEMHVIPQAEVLRIARRAEVELVELRDDSHHLVARPDLSISNLFLFRRPV
jgi:SAM-dependent methyltransferase